MSRLSIQIRVDTVKIGSYPEHCVNINDLVIFVISTDDRSGEISLIKREISPLLSTER